MTDVITRFAPSPTGHLHIGGARTALFCWAFARKHKGRFVVRIEDTDRARSSDDAVRGILEDLAWLAIDWDDGPSHTMDGRVIAADARDVGSYYQSQRLDTYRAHLDRLLEADLAYPAFETPEELDAKRKAAVAAKETYRYDRGALEIPREERMARYRDGEACVIRFKSPGADVVVDDQALGEIRFDGAELDDFIILKRDGFPTYHFAVVVDDELMGVTHILRGQEHLINTPRHMQLQGALGFRHPAYAHMPLIFNTDGSKMSKRDKDKAARAVCKERGIADPPCESIDGARFSKWLKDKKSQLETEQLRDLASTLEIDLPEIDVDDFRRSGYLPGVVCNYLSRLGLSLGDDVDRFDMAYLVERFELGRIGKSNAKFDRAKLLAFNNDTLTTMDAGAWNGLFVEWCRRERPAQLEAIESAGVLEVYGEAMRPRSKTLKEAAERGGFVMQDDATFEFDEKAVQKGLIKGEPSGISLLGEFLPLLRDVEPFDTDAINACVASFCESRSVGMGKIAQPLRVALTGTVVSPPIDLTLVLLGRKRAVVRIERCLEMYVR